MSTPTTSAVPNRRRPSRTSKVSNEAVHGSRIEGGDQGECVPSWSVAALLYALGSTPITPYSLRTTRPWGIPVFLSLSFWGGIWTIPIAWVSDRLPREGGSIGSAQSAVAHCPRP